MKITVSQLRRIIREAVERELNTGKCPKCGTSVQLTSGGLVTYHDYKNPLGDTQNCPGSQMKPVKESKGFDDYIRDTPTLWDSPKPQTIYNEFLNLSDRNGEVPIQKLADELGIHVNRIDFNRTRLRVMDGVVTKLLGDTPYRTDR